MAGKVQNFQSVFLPEPLVQATPVRSNLGHPWTLIFSLLMGLVYIPLSCILPVNYAVTLGVLVHAVLLTMASDQLHPSRQLFTDQILQLAAKVHSAMCWAHCVVALLIFSLHQEHHGTPASCALHLSTCGVILGIGKVTQLAFLFEKHYLASQSPSCFSPPQNANFWRGALARVTTPQGVTALLICGPMFYFTAMVFWQMGFRDDCVYLSPEPWKTGCFICISLLTLLVGCLHLHLAYVKYRFAGHHQKMVSRRLLFAAFACLVPTFSADMYVLYISPSFPIAACLNYCGWYMMVGLQGMRYIASTTHVLGLQTATFVDGATWQVMASCPLHEQLLNGPLVGRSLLDLIVEPDRRQLLNINTQQDTYLLLLRFQTISEGALLSVLVRMHWLGDRQWQIHLEDITEYLNHTELRIQEYRDVLCAVQQPIATTDANLCITYVNPAWMEFGEYLESAQVLGLPITAAFPNFDPTVPLLDAMHTHVMSRWTGSQATVGLAAVKLHIGGAVMYVITLQAEMPQAVSYESFGSLYHKSSFGDPQDPANGALAVHKCSMDENVGSDAGAQHGNRHMGHNGLPSQLNVLIVESHQADADMLKNQLTQSTPFAPSKWNVTAVTCGVEALDQLGGELKFHVVIIEDCEQPLGGGLGGIETTEAIRQDEDMHSGPRKVIVGVGSSGHRQCALGVGHDLFWSKPLPAAEVMYQDLSQLHWPEGWYREHTV